MLNVSPSEQTNYLRGLIGKKPIRRDELEAVTADYTLNARESFRYFRCMLRPGMITSWWTDEIAAVMQKFADSLFGHGFFAPGGPSPKGWAEHFSFCPGSSDINLFGYRKSIINLDAEIAHGTRCSALSVRDAPVRDVTMSPTSLRSTDAAGI